MKNRKALCIGINAYFKKLDNAINDATSMHELLTYKGYDSTLQTDLNYNDFDQCIDDFCNSINNDTEAIIFFYAGHGVESKSINYLLPSDLDENPLAYGGYSLELVLEKIEVKCEKEIPKIIILDACRSDKENDLLKQLSRNNDINEITLGQTQPSNKNENYLIAFSTSPGNVAYDGNKKNDSTNGIYTKALIESFKNYYLPIEVMLKNTREEVLKTSDYKQLPWEHSSLNKSFYIDFKPNHKYLVDIHDTPFTLVNDIIFINDTKYIAIGDAPCLYVKDITNQFESNIIPLTSVIFKEEIEKEKELDAKFKQVLDLYNELKENDNSFINDINELSEKLEIEVSIAELIDGERKTNTESNEASRLSLDSIARSKNYIVVTSSNSKLIILDKERINSVDYKSNKDQELRSIVISEDEKYCAFANFNRLVIIDLITKNIIYDSKVSYLEEIYSLAFMPGTNNDIILCGSKNKLELITDINTNKENRKEFKTDKYTYKIKFTPNKEKMITTHNKGKVRIWDAKTLELLKTISLEEEISNQVTVLNIKKDGNDIPSNHIVSLSIINDTLIAVGTYNVSYCLIDIELYKIIKEEPLDSTTLTPYGIACNENYLVCNGYKKTNYIYSTNKTIPFISEDEYFDNKDDEITFIKETEILYQSLFQ